MKVAIFDARGLFDRAWHASRNSEELAHVPSWHVSGAACVYILASLLGPGGRLPFNPTHALFCWDGKFQKSLKPRLPKPPEHGADLRYFQGWLPALVGGAHYVADTAESDDAVATAAVLASEDQAVTDLCVVSGDKDLQQLISDRVRYYCLNKRVEITATDVTDRWHVRSPGELAVALAILGDRADGIVGVKGWGPKAVQRLFEGLPEEPVDALVDDIAARLPADQVDNFYASLEATILNTAVPGVPAPEPVILASMDDFKKSGLDLARSNWSRLLSHNLDLEDVTLSRSSMDEDDLA